METENTIAAVVIDSSRANDRYTGHVLLGGTDGLTDGELASLAGFSSSHYGYSVTRYDDGTSTVHLWND